jgi:diphthamide synthase subunit DPH2
MKTIVLCSSANFYEHTNQIAAELEKRGFKAVVPVTGYIGSNVLMEMGLAFYLKKPIFILNPVSDDMPVYEEVIGMGSVIIDGDLMKVQF